MYCVEAETRQQADVIGTLRADKAQLATALLDTQQQLDECSGARARLQRERDELQQRLERLADDMRERERRMELTLQAHCAEVEASHAALDSTSRDLRERIGQLEHSLALEKRAHNEDKLRFEKERSLLASQLEAAVRAKASMEECALIANTEKQSLRGELTRISRSSTSMQASADEQSRTLGMLFMLMQPCVAHTYSNQLLLLS